MTDLVDKEIGSYKLVEMIGKGGQGRVYRAVDLSNDRAAAVKVFTFQGSDRREKLARFKYEAHLASALDHPNICTVYELFEDADHTYMVMEHVDGKNLFELAFARPLAVTSALSIAIQVTDALTAAHAAGIIHRDIKPRNVIVEDSGRAVLLDFGLAKLIEEGGAESEQLSRETFFADIEEDIFETQEGFPMGTPSSSPPEMALGRPSDHRGDVFSTGVLLYLSLTGKYPFLGKTKREVRKQIIEDDPTPINAARRAIEAVSPELIAVVERSISKDPENRFQNMSEMRDALRSILYSELGETSGVGNLETTIFPGVATRPVHAPLISTRDRKKAVMIGIAGLILLLLLLAALYFLF
ncbi:MAG: serine/threonine-protein kinase [Acidobacteriota bacterium]